MRPRAEVEPRVEPSSHYRDCNFGGETGESQRRENFGIGTMTDEERIKYELELDRLRYQRELAVKQAEEQPKLKSAPMGWGVFLIALLLSLVADAVEFFTLGTIGWLVGLFVDLILFLMLGFTAAGRKQFKKWIWGPLIEKIPFLNTLPFLRAAFLIWSFISSRSRLVQKAGAAAKIF